MPRSTNLHHKSAPNLPHVSFQSEVAHIHTSLAALSPLRFNPPLSHAHSPPRSTLLVLAGTITFQTQLTQHKVPPAHRHTTRLASSCSHRKLSPVLPLRAARARTASYVSTSPLHSKSSTTLQALNRSMQGPRYAMLFHLAITLSTVHGWVISSDDKASSLSSHESAITGGIDGARRQLKASGCSGSWSVCPPAPRPLLHITLFDAWPPFARSDSGTCTSEGSCDGSCSRYFLIDMNCYFDYGN